jgi:hypothetical protein
MLVWMWACARTGGGAGGRRGSPGVVRKRIEGSLGDPEGNTEELKIVHRHIKMRSVVRKTDREALARMVNPKTIFAGLGADSNGKRRRDKWYGL